MLEYLYNNYGKINMESKNKNIEQMKEPHDITTPIELFSNKFNIPSTLLALHEAH